MKKLRVAFCLAVLLLLLAACEGDNHALSIGKQQTVSNEEISTYLNEIYFFPYGIELSEVNDVVEYPGEVENKIMLICTTIASNYYATQTANWELNFERFNGTWVGTDYQLGVNDREVRELSIEEFGAIVCPEYGSNKYFEVINLETDFENKTVTAQTTYYQVFPGFYRSVPWTMSLYWDAKSMCWTYNHPSTYEFNERTHGMNWQLHVPDISGHYDDNGHVIFDIECDPEGNGSHDVFAIKNFSYCYNEKYRGDYNGSPFSLEFYQWNPLLQGLLTRLKLFRTQDNGEQVYTNVTISLEGNVLYIRFESGLYPVATFTNEFVPQETYLQGTYSS